MVEPIASWRCPDHSGFEAQFEHVYGELKEGKKTMADLAGEIKATNRDLTRQFNSVKRWIYGTLITFLTAMVITLVSVVLRMKVG